MASMLLLLQLLIIALTALALTAPLPAGGSAATLHRIFVLDASGSMRASDVAPDRFSVAKHRLERELAATDFAGNTMVSILIAGPTPELVAARHHDASALANRLELLRASDGTADWERVGQLLETISRTDDRIEILLLSDRAGADPLPALQALMPNSIVENVPIGTSTFNAGFTDVTIESLDSEGGRWRIEGSLAESGGVKADLPVGVHFRPSEESGFLEWGEQEINFDEHSSSSGFGSFEFDLTLPAAGMLELRLPADSSPHDNLATFRLAKRPRSARVLHVGPENRPLLRALRALEQVEVFRADTLPADSSSYDLVIVDRTTLDRHPQTHSLWLGGAYAESDGIPVPLQDPTPSGWQQHHALSPSVDWGNLTVSRALALRRSPGAEVLLEASGSPLVQARTTEFGREVRVAFELDDSNWPERSAFPAFVANLLHWAIPDLGATVSVGCRVGQPCDIDYRILRGGARLVTPSGDEFHLPSPFVAPPSRSEAAWATPGLDELFRPQQVGTYLVESAAGRQEVPVNGFFEDEVELEPAEAGPSNTEPTDSPLANGVARALLVAVLVLLAAEAWLAGRGSERFLTHSGLRRGNPLALRRRWMLALRLLAVALLVLAISDTPLFAPAREQNVVVVADMAPYPEETQAALAHLLQRTEQSAGAGRRRGLVSIGATSAVTADLGETGSLQSQVSSLPAADLEMALDLATAMIPGRPGDRVVVASTGIETRGSAAAALYRLRTRGIPIDAYPLPSLPANEVIVERPVIPERLFEGDRFPLQAMIYSERSGQATVQILREKEVVAQREVQLQGGRNVVEMTASEPEAGSFLYEVAITTAHDEFAGNNRNGAVARVARHPRVVVFSPQHSLGQQLVDALDVQGISADVMPPDRAPWYLKDWLEYDVVVLMNVPAIDLHTKQQELLETAVREHGTGLVILGGENSFGPGGYYETPLERLSPLSSRIPREGPAVTLLFVLDRSGSMQQVVGDVTRLEIAKEATLDAAALLNEESRVGVVAFDSDATLLLPLQSAGESESIAQALAPLEPGGGTSIYPGLLEAYEQLRDDEAGARHVVLMTDGLSQPGEFPAILRRMNEAGISVSAVAIGEGADVGRIEQIARLGGGAFHATRDFNALPSILSQEALLLSSTPVEERTITPRWETVPSFFSGLPEQLPPLHGYVLTTLKSEATNHLSTRAENGDEVPLLASWRFGAGRVFAFSSHGAGSWSGDWQAMAQYPLLWSQVVRRTLPATQRPGLHLSLQHNGDEVRVDLRAVDDEGAAPPELEPRATLSGPGNDLRSPLMLTEITPGLYRGSFVVDKVGAYQTAIEANEEQVEAQTVITYPALWNFSRANADLLEATTALTGGRMLLGDEVIFSGPSWYWSSRSGWRIWTILATALFMADLLLRYAPGIFGWRRSPRIYSNFTRAL